MQTTLTYLDYLYFNMFLLLLQTSPLYIQSNLLERPPVYKDHLSIKITLVQSLYLFHVIKPVYKDHLSNATRDRPILGPYAQLHPAYKDHNVRLCFVITSRTDNIMVSELRMLCSHAKAGVHCY